jgi:parallel beta-helix repeat protein
MAAATAVVLFVAVGASQAATICVNPDKTSCEATIQGAVDLAVAGDTVKLASGVYFENVVITTAGITVKGGKNAILDPTFPGACSTAATACYDSGDCPGVETCDNVGDDDGISVDANNVVLRGFTIRNGQDNSIEIEDTVTGTEIRNMRLFASDSYCIYGDGGTSAGPTTVRGNEFTACGSDCLYLSGTWDAVEVSKNKMMQCNGYGIDISGDDTIVENNRIDNMDGPGVYLDGDRAEVVSNRVSMIYDEGVYVDGDDALIQSNRIDNVSDHGIELDGNGATVTKNRLTNIAYDYAIDFEGDDGVISRNTVKGTDESGMDVECDDGSGVCTDGIVIERNTLTDVGFDDYEGIYVYAEDGTGGVDISRNRLRNVGYHGIDYSGAAGSGPATIERNSVRNAGRAGNECFDLADGDLDSLVIDRNTARDCGGHGFEVDGTDHKLTNNKVKNVGNSGVDVDSSAVNIEITGNKISGAAMNGVEIESGANGTVVTGNKIKNNRVDICNEGTGSASGGDNKPSGMSVETALCANL